MTQAKQGDTVQVNYTGKLQDGTVFDTSRDRGPLRFTVGKGQLIAGFEQAVLGMNIGEKKTVVWTNKATGVTYRLTPTRNFKQGNTPCREFTTAVSAGRKKDSVKGVACRSGEGEWVFKL